jgi:hypothetical protein
VILTQLVEACGLDQHPRVRPSQPGDGKHTDDRRRNEQVCVVKWNRDLIQVAVFVAADDHNVVTLFKLQSEILAQSVTAKYRGSERCLLGNDPKQMNSSNSHSEIATLLSVLRKGNKRGILAQQRYQWATYHKLAIS